MKLKAIVDSLDDVPEEFHVLYTEKNGKFEFTGVEGIKTQADIDRLQTGLTKERSEHKATKEKLKVFTSLADDPEELQAKLDRIEELEAAAGGKLDEGKLNEMVEVRLKSRIAPVERELKKAQQQLGEYEAEVTNYRTQNRQRTITDAVTSAARNAKVQDFAMEDALMYAERVFDVNEEGNIVVKDNVGFTPGVEPSVWLTEIAEKKPHWFAAPSYGGGAGGSRNSSQGTVNPFTAENWNATKQGELYKQDPKRAEQLAKAAGTSLGGPKPAPRSN